MQDGAHAKLYTPTLWMWVIPTVVTLVSGMAALILGSELRRLPFFLDTADYAILPLLVATALGWIVSWRQQHRPWLSEMAGLAAAACWCLCAVAVDVCFQLQSDMTILLTALLGLVWVPWALRQRILLGAEMAVCFILAEIWLYPAWEDMLPLLIAAIAYGWWMLAERLRESEGLYADYAWVGVPASFSFLLATQLFICHSLGGHRFLTHLHEHPYTLAAAAGVLIALLLTLRPRVYGRAWLVVAAVAVLPTMAAVLWASDPSQNIARWLLALPCPVALLWLAVSQRRREWVLACTLNLFIWCSQHPFYYELSHEEGSLLLWLIGFVLIALSILLYRKARTAS